ncbi:hypothetical protein [Variovorax sp. KK3]|uniref:hypothetical protein n=1 Tax=Variovorax sp. KK3 TaxID=1855728 RepID=UPI00097C32F9|nr:hypothetical protein [Variovorax sp. KK3]
MKITQLTSVGVTRSTRQPIESVHRDGESLAKFVEKAAVQVARQRPAQQAFVARGRASLARSLETGELYAATDALDAMRARLIALKATLSHVDSPSTTGSNAKP